MEFSRALILVALCSVPLLAEHNENERAATLEERLAIQEARIEELEDLIAEQSAVLLELRRDLAGGSSPGDDPATALIQTRLPEAQAAPIAPAPVQASTSPTAGWTSSHAFVRSEDGRYRVELSGRVHLDYRGYTGEGKPPSTFLMRRVYFGAEGEFGERYSWVLTADVADDDSTLLRDAYWNIHLNDAVSFRSGQFKAPFSQEEVQSDNRITFVERHSITNLAPSRTPAVMVYGSALDEAVSYQLAAYNGLGLLAQNDTPTPEVGARLRFRPLKDVSGFENFVVGGAASQGRHTDGFSFRGRTATRSVTFFEPVPVRGKVIRANAEFEWIRDRFSLRGEFAQTNQARDGLGPGGTSLPGVVAKGFSAEASYVFGGDIQPNGSLIPRTVLLEGAGRGALQLAFRYENLQLHDSVDPNRSDAFTFGLNWQMSRFVRHMSNFAFERFQNPDRNASFAGDHTFSYVSRMQLIF